MAKKKAAAKRPRDGKATFRARLVRLLALTGELNPQTFNMGLWCDADHGCGTVGCLGGHAAMLPDFQAQGLKIDPKTEIITYHGKRYGTSNTDTLQRFFGLTHHEAHRLFMSWEIRHGVEALTERANVVLDLLHNDLLGRRSPGFRLPRFSSPSDEAPATCTTPSGN